MEPWPPTGPSGSALGMDRNLSHKGLDTGLINPLMNTILSSVVPDKKYRKRERKWKFKKEKKRKTQPMKNNHGSNLCNLRFN